MTIFVLKVREESQTAGRMPVDYNPYSDYAGHVVVAHGEQAARAMCANPEGPYESEAPWWLDEALTSCEEVVDDGQARVILSDTPTG